MDFSNVAVAGVCHVDAPHVVSSHTIEAELAATLKRLKLPPGLLDGLSGIANRRFWDPRMPVSEAATIAGHKALTLANVDRRDVGVLINTSVCRDHLEPSTACITHHKLGLGPDCLNFDVSNACLGFLNGMDLVGNMIERGQVAYGLIVNAESSRFVVEQTVARLARPDCDLQALRGNYATLTLGSGAAAMVLARADLASSRHRFTNSISRAATQHHQLCVGDVDHMTTDTQALTAAGVALARDTWRLAGSALGWTPQSIDEVVLHQVSKVHTIRITEALAIDPGKVLAIYPEFGNIGPAALPIALSKSVEAGRIEAGSRIALMGIGSGLNCTMSEIIW
ncbi:MAG: 3-oxoacyl-ACP synthase III [Hyphomicrobiales bacterium]|nr:3-oxoacyl-ACP synthase III [Hyphomicrobiales bacterium]